MKLFKYIKYFFTLLFIAFLIAASYVTIAGNFEPAWLVLLIAHLLIALLLSTNILVSKRNWHQKISWILAIIFLPVICTLGFLIWGRTYLNKQQNKKVFKKRNNYFDIPREQINNKLIADFEESLNVTDANLFNVNDITIIKTGNEKINLLFEEVKNSTKFIYISYYVLSEGILLTALFKLLEEKAKQGVKVYILYDGLGSIFEFNIKNWKKFSQLENIHLVNYKHPKNLFKFFNINFNYRYHRKIILIDGKVAFFGGFNLGNEYISLTARFGLWKDTHFLVRGNAVSWLQRLFEYDWLFFTNQNILNSIEHKANPVIADSAIQFIDNGPEFKDSLHLQILEKYFERANTSITLVTPYLICPKTLVNLLIKKAKTLKVKIIIPEIPDKKSAYAFTLKYAQLLQKNNVEINYFRNSFIHTKLCLIDEKIALMGSVNLDHRSLQQNYELMSILSGKFIEKIKEEINDILEHSYLAPTIKRNILKRILSSYLYIVEPIY